MAAFLACACKLSWTLFSFRPGLAAIGGGKKGEFRDWTTSHHAFPSVGILSQCFQTKIKYDFCQHERKEAQK